MYHYAAEAMQGMDAEMMNDAYRKNMTFAVSDDENI